MFAGRPLDSSLPLVVAEVGFNHEGDMAVAREMIRAAAGAGAHLVKFQTFAATDIALPGSPHFDLIRAGELDLPRMRDLAAAARESGIEFFSTPFSTRAVEQLEAVGAPLYKVASMDLTNRRLLAAVAETGKPAILSTGMASLAEIAASVEFMLGRGAESLALLHCLSLYPANAEDLNLAAIGFLRRTFGLPVGWSDHFPGAKACLAAWFHGAQIIETHFTLDAERGDGDHAHSTDPASLKALLDDIRLFAAMRGSEDFFALRADRLFAPQFRRGVHAARDLGAGERPGLDDLLFCRPQGELTPDDAAPLLGRALARPVRRYSPLGLDDFTGAKA